MKILLAVDDSPSSRAAVDTVAAQFPSKETEIRVLHVVEPVAMTPPPEMAAGYYPELKDALEKAKKWVEGVAGKLRGAGFRVNTAVEAGDARSVIVDSAASWPADLIVVGAHGHKKLQRFLLGSVSEAVARHAQCSVEIVRAPGAQ